MTVEKLTSIPLTDVSQAEIITTTGSKTYRFETASEVGTEEVVSEGEEQTLKIKGKIWANKKAEDTTLGYDLTLKNNVFIPEVVKVLNGGTITTDPESGGAFKKYEAPAMGEKVVKEKFTLSFYSEEVAPDGPTGRYAKITFPSCMGAKCPISMKDGEYFASEIIIKSRPANGEKPYTIEMVDALPAGV